MLSLEITIPIASIWPSSAELAARNAVEAALIASGIGQCTGAGGGRGLMHLTLRIADESAFSAASSAISNAMNLYMPGVQYQIQKALEESL